MPWRAIFGIKKSPHYCLGGLSLGSRKSHIIGSRSLNSYLLMALLYEFEDSILIQNDMVGGFSFLFVSVDEVFPINNAKTNISTTKDYPHQHCIMMDL